MFNRISLCLSLALAFSSSAAQAHNLFVTPGGSGEVCNVDQPCASVQLAIDAAESGDHIFIGPGTYHENLTVAVDKSELRISGTGNDQVFIVSPLSSQDINGDAKLDIVLDIFASGVTVEKLSLIHPPGQTLNRDIGVFIHGSAHGTVIQKTHIERQRDSGNLEPSEPGPGSRGILVLRAKGTHLVKNEVGGNYQDAIHLPANKSVVMKNHVYDATRIGIAAIQETQTSDNNNSTITKNFISNSGVDGIQIQSDHNTVSHNNIRNSQGNAITLCGVGTVCVAPGVNASADNNTVSGNVLINNNTDIVDGGVGNIIEQ